MLGLLAEQEQGGGADVATPSTAAATAWSTGTAKAGSEVDSEVATESSVWVVSAAPAIGRAALI
ncbi:MAG: hypothetical protein ABIZ34_00470 [Candidatus Limnocylindrales bacterium]